MDFSGTSDNERLRGLLEAWFASMEAGEQPTVEQICASDPDLASVLRRLVEQESDVVEALGSIAPPRGEERALEVERLGDFKLISFLGAGGMGQVHLARQESLSRLVALKVLPAAATEDQSSLARFRREAEIAAGLDHGNIVPVYAVGEAHGYAFLAMKWLSGPALDQLSEPLDPREVARIGAAIARALHEAHEAGIIHRDVKPGNVMLDGPTPYILDFGLARARADVTLTRRGGVPRTLPYMSPEQLRAGASRSTLDGRTDIYSLGATLYEVACGRCPFVGDEPEIMIREIFFKEPPPLDLPASACDLQTIIMRAMDKDRERRFVTAVALAEDLERYLQGLPIVSRPIGPLTRVIKTVRRHKVAAVISGAAFAVILALMVVVAIDRVNAANRFEDHLREADVHLASDRLDLAAQVSSVLRRERSDSAEVLHLERRIAAARSLEEMLDRILEGREAQDVGILGVVTGELGRLVDDMGGWDSRDARRAQTWSLARAVVAIRDRVGDPRRALDILEGMSGRDVAALRALAEGRELTGLPSAGERGVQEHVFTYIALREADRSRSDQLSEIALAQRLPGGLSDDRVLYARAVWLAADDDQALAAKVGFESLDRGDGDLRPSLLRNLIRQNVVLGDLAAASRTYEQYRTKRPDQSTWTPTEMAVVCELLVRLGRNAEAAALLERAFGDYPEHWKLLMLKAHQVLEVDPERALVLLETAASPPHKRWRRERAGATSLLVRLQVHPSMVDERSSLSRDDRGALLALDAECERFLGSVADPLARSDTLYVRARIAGRMGLTEVRIRRLRSAVSAAPSNARPVIDLGYLAFLGADEERDLVDEALPHVDRILGRGFRGERPPSRSELFRALYIRGVLRFVTGDYRASVADLEDVLQLAEDGPEFDAGLGDPARFVYFARVRDGAAARIK